MASAFELLALCVLVVAGGLRVAFSVSYAFVMTLWPWDLYLYPLAVLLAPLLYWAIRQSTQKHEDRIYLASALIRAEVAFMMMFYGVSKVALQQFAQSYSDQDCRMLTATGLMKAWSFFGHSAAYESFLGWGECLGSLLLLFYITVPAGALILAIILVNIVFTNFTHDIGVRANSSLYLLQTVALLWPERGRIIAFLRGVAVPTRPLPGIVERQGKRLTVARAVVVTAMASFVFYNQRMHVVHKPQPHPLVGIWQASVPTSLQRLRFDNDHGGSLSRVEEDRVEFEYHFQPGQLPLKIEVVSEGKWTPCFQGQAVLVNASQLVLTPDGGPSIRYRRIKP